MNGEVLKGEDLLCRLVLSSSDDASGRKSFVKDAAGYQELNSYVFENFVRETRSKKRGSTDIEDNQTGEEDEKLSSKEAASVPKRKKK